MGVHKPKNLGLRDVNQTAFISALSDNRCSADSVNEA